MNPIRVLFLTGSLNLGGTERNILHLATRLSPERFRVEVWSDYEGEPVQAQLRARGIPCRALKSGSSLGRPLLTRLLRHNLPYQWRLFRLLRANRESVVHAFGFPMAYYAVLIGRLAGCRRIVFSVQDWDVWKRSGVYAMLDRISSRLAKRVVADGQGARRLAARRQGMAPDRLVTIYDGVDAEELKASRDPAETRRDLGLAPDGVTVGMIARLDLAKKGQDVFLRAIPAIRAKAPGTQFVLVGDGPDRARIEALLQSLPAGARPVMAGRRTDLADVIAALDVLAIPSRWESVPKILLEAMWLTRAVVAAAVGDIPEILDETCGALVPPNDPGALADAVGRFAGDEDYRLRIGRAAHERIRALGLTLDDSVRAYEKLYEEI
ncbi:MAG: glycosyltransferase [Candidatus Brocadiia bacterium]